jgi:predicted  nucleic acid-binding Zn-ribbon protein
MSRTPHDLLVARHKPYRQAFERVQRAVEARQCAQERVQELERKLAEGGDFDKLRPAVDEAKQQAEAAAHRVERVGREFDRMPAERRSEWLQQAQRDFQTARQAYEEQLGRIPEARQQLADEAALLASITGGQTAQMASKLHVRHDEIAGLSAEVRVEDVFAALRDELVNLEMSVLLGGRT